MASIYDHPGTYDLEHCGPQKDISFFLRLAEQHRPARMVEWACGNGRITIPLAQTGVAWKGSVTGVDVSGPMLEAARKADADELVKWCEGDVVSWKPETKCDFLFSGCGSLSHLTDTEQQMAAWRNAYDSLAEGGRFVVAEVMPDYAMLADAMRSPSRAAVCLDGDFEEDEVRLLRCRAARYTAHRQMMRVRYFYDRFERGEAARFVDDYDAHVFFPNELRLLFRLTGFEIEAEWGDYEGGGLKHASRGLIMCGIKRQLREKPNDRVAEKSRIAGGM